jgi:ferric iron reductase protein FhuF
VVDEHLGGLVATVSRAAPAAAGMLWGNVASGIAGTLRTLGVSGLAPVRASYDVGLAVLDHGPLRGAGTLTVHNGQLRFRRRSCCLYYRLDGGGLCGDCALANT